MVKHSTTAVDGTTEINATYLNADHVASTSGAALELIWKTDGAIVLSLDDQTADISWTDLDLTASTSANAKLVLLQVTMLSNVASKYYIFSARKNGTASSNVPLLKIDSTVDHTTFISAQIIVGMDSNQIIEYALSQQLGGSSIDLTITVLAYWE